MAWGQREELEGLRGHRQSPCWLPNPEQMLEAVSIYLCLLQMCLPWLSLNLSFGLVFGKTSWAKRGVSREQHQKWLE